uniref:Wsv270-like protein n=1 Tax=Metapenaeus ensis nimavirus TaxID=2133794 RepID=A0A401IP90_9VIRU|nr:MAG: wsv270-like protein [Metapenaeus ensis nimavirus]GBG35438.1 wsv270-like protein [Metapenaeus ensis nimavirus]
MGEKKSAVKKYFVVDCDSPVPSTLTRTIDIQLRLHEHLNASIPSSDDSFNIIVGVTKGDIEQCETALRIVMESINHQRGRIDIREYCILNSITGCVEAGKVGPPDVKGKLHVLSKRPATKALFKDKSCWWNQHKRLKRRRRASKTTSAKQNEGSH